MKQNLGVVDRVLRFALAFWWLSPLAPQFSAGWGNAVVIVIAWIALIESFIGWCWFHDLFHMDSKNQ